MGPDHDVTNAFGIARKDPCIEYLGRLHVPKHPMVRVERHQIGPASGHDPASVNAQRSSSAGGRRDMHSAPGRGLVIAREDRALMSHQPLSVFEQAKLLDDADHDVTVGADAKAPRSG